MEGYIQHPAEIPIEYELDGDDGFEAKDRDAGGIAFYASEHICPGTMLKLKIVCGRHDFRAHVRVAWCRQVDSRMLVGVEFGSTDEFFQARMVEQACHIEWYRHRVACVEGRQLTRRDAALEWIDKFADHFPRLKKT